MSESTADSFSSLDLPAGDPQAAEPARHLARQHADPAGHLRRIRDSRLTLLVAQGDPAEVLVAAAKGADLLVVGTRGRSPFLGAVLGSVGLRCATAAACPVTLVKLPGEQPEAGARP